MFTAAAAAVAAFPSGETLLLSAMAFIFVLLPWWRTLRPAPPEFMTPRFWTESRIQKLQSVQCISANSSHLEWSRENKVISLCIFLLLVHFAEFWALEVGFWKLIKFQNLLDESYAIRSSCFNLSISILSTRRHNTLKSFRPKKSTFCTSNFISKNLSIK